MTNGLKEERTRQNYTQVQLAEATGVSRQTIISIESGRYIPSVLLAMKIAAALSLSVEDLFFPEKGD